MKASMAVATLAGLLGFLALLFAARIDGQAQDGGPKWNICRHGPASRGTSWDPESARRNYRSFVSEVGKALERVQIERQRKLSIEPQHLQGCKQSRTRIQKLSVPADFSGGIAFASTRDARALGRLVKKPSLVVFVDYEKFEDVLEAARDLGVKWSLGSKDAAAALGVACVPSIVTPVKPGIVTDSSGRPADSATEVRIDEINFR